MGIRVALNHKTHYAMPLRREYYKDGTSGAAHTMLHIQVADITIAFR